VTPARELVRRVTRRRALPFCPELTLALADEPLAPWLAAEAASGQREEPPFWAHAWPGGLALARFVLDAPDLVKGKQVLDFASGCGVSAVAAAKAGARAVVAAEIDPFALAAIEENAELNGAQLELRAGDLIGLDEGWEVVLVGDVFYQAQLSVRLERWLATLAARGASIFIGDPGRTFLPVPRLRCAASYEILAVPAWDSVLDRPARVWQLEA